MNIPKLFSVALLAIATTGILSSCHTSRKGMKKLYKEVKKDQTSAQVSWKGDSIRIVYPELAMFDFGKDQIKQEAYPAFKRYADIMNHYNWVSFVINGYTDNVGPDDVNKSLSERRATSARDLLQTDGISSSRMSTNGFGSGNPIMDNTTEQGRQANRRVEFLLYKKQ